MKKSFFALLCIIIALSLLMSSCSGEELAPNNTQILNVSLGGNPKSLDPAYCLDTAVGSVILHIFEGLTILGSNGNAEMAQAESCELSEDGRTYTFVLREGLKWSDGRDVVAGDFSYAWTRAANIADNAGSAYLFDIMKDADGNLNVETPDDMTIIVKLKEVSTYFLKLLALPVFCPVRRDSIANSGDKWSTKSGTCIGNGAYTLNTFTIGSHIALEKNNNYRAADAVKIKTLNFVNMGGTKAYDAYLSGDILFADSLAVSKIEEAKKLGGFNNLPLYGTYYLVFNTSVEPFDDPFVREALNLAVDRKALNDTICAGVNTPANAFVPPGILQDENSDYRKKHGGFIENDNHNKNIENAKNLLLAAGYESFEDFPTIEYIYPEGAEHRLIAEFLQHMWAEVGIVVSLKEQSQDELLKNMSTGNYQIAKNAWLCDYDDPLSILSLFKSGNKKNYSAWSNENYDELLADAAKEGDLELRSELYFEAEKMLFEDWIICPIHYYSDVYLQSEYLSGVRISPLGYKNFAFSSIKTAND